MKKVLVGLIIAGFLIKAAEAQEADSSRMGIGVIRGSDTIIHREIKEIWVYPRNKFDNPRQERKYHRLIQRVKKVYPYAMKAKELLHKYEPEYLSMRTDRERRLLVKKVEEELMSKYKEELKKFSITDGKILIKLIDRETGKTSYTIIKEFKGSFAAAFWQTVARLFRNNLKDEFDPYGEDMLIDQIVTLIEYGYL